MEFPPFEKESKGISTMMIDEKQEIQGKQRKQRKQRKQEKQEYLAVFDGDFRFSKKKTSNEEEEEYLIIKREKTIAELLVELFEVINRKIRIRRNRI